MFLFPLYIKEYFKFNLKLYICSSSFPYRMNVRSNMEVYIKPLLTNLPIYNLLCRVFRVFRVFRVSDHFEYGAPLCVYHVSASCIQWDR